jgi:phosphotransferase system enzyme I (PtsI)
MRWLRSLIGTSPIEKGSDECVIRGLAVSGGVAIGPIHVLKDAATARRQFTSVTDETEAFRSALAAASGQLETLIASQDRLAGEILEFQLALLEDDDMLAPVYSAIEGGAACDAAWTAMLDTEIAEYRDSGDATLTARASDLADLRGRVLRALHGDSTNSQQTDYPAGAIVVASDLTPSAFLDLDWDRIGGAAIIGGSPTSHVSILARARGVNLVVGLETELSAIRNGASAILDAGDGILVLEPGEETIAVAQRKLAAAGSDLEIIEALIARPAATAAGEPVKLLVNIDEPDRLASIPADHCDGVGLTRTEFLFKDGKQPNEDEQLAFYRGLIEWAGGRPVTIRTLDAGGDKPIPGVTVDGEANPFLGVRGLRLSLARPEIFRVQLRALARAAAIGRINIMVPMVTVPDELDVARQMMLAEIADLERAGIVCATPPIGMMIEVPAAALNATSFNADFYSIGSNDLIQYVTACARDNAALARLADPRNPAVIELIRRTVEAGKARGVDVSLCGDMASTPDLVALLLDTGLRALSAAPAQIGPVKLAVSRYGRTD